MYRDEQRTMARSNEGANIEQVFAWVVGGACTLKREEDMDWVSNDRCSQCGKEGSE